MKFFDFSLQIAEDDRLPKCLCYRCMYNLENFYDFRTACVNAVAMLEKCLPPDAVRWLFVSSIILSRFWLISKMITECISLQAKVEIKQEKIDSSEPYSELRMELLKDKETGNGSAVGMSMLIPEVPVVNPNAALGTPPRLKSDGELDNDEIRDAAAGDER